MYEAPRTHLIKSTYWKMWHRRSVGPDGEERATGYTADIAEAGVFTESFAMSYDDSKLEEHQRRDVAVPIKEAEAQIKGRILELRQKADEAERNLLTAFDHISPPEGVLAVIDKIVSDAEKKYGQGVLDREFSQQENHLTWYAGHTIRRRGHDPRTIDGVTMYPERAVSAAFVLGRRIGTLDAQEIADGMVSDRLAAARAALNGDH